MNTGNIIRFQECRTAMLLALLLSALTLVTLSATTMAGTVISSAAEPDYPPLSFEDAQGRASGLAVELLSAAAQAMGREVNFAMRPWSKISQELAADQLDVLPLVGRTPERESLYDFTVPYLSLYGAIVVKRGNDTIFSADDLHGRKVGVMLADNAEEYMRREGFGPSLITTQSYSEALRQLNRGQLDAVVMQQLVAQRLIQTLGLEGVEIRNRIADFRQDFCFAVTDGDQELLATLNEGLSLIMSNGTHARLTDKWLGSTDPAKFDFSSQFNQLTEAEKRWIAKHPVVSFTGDPNWLPYEAFNAQGHYIGIVADHLKLVEKKTGLSFKPIPVTSWTESLNIATEGQVSVISGDSADAILNRQFEPVESYSHNPIVIIMNVRQNYVENLDEIKGRRIAIIKDYGYTADIFSHYPDIEFIEVENIQEGLEGVSQGRHDALLATMALASYTIAEMGLHNIKVVGKTPITMDLTLFVAKEQPLLHSIINKALKSVSRIESQAILQSWVKNKYVERTDYRMAILVGIGLLIILLIILARNRRLQLEIRSRREMEQALTESRVLLEEAQAMAHVGNWELAPITMKTFWSDEVFRILGIKKTDDVGPELLSSLLHPDDREAVLSSLQCAVADGQKHHMEYRIVRPDGEVRWLECQAEQQYDDNGNLLKLRGVFQEITQRKLDELKLQQSEARFRKLFENTDAISVQGYNKERQVIYWNRASEALYGFTADEAMGRPMEDLIIPNHMRDEVISGLSTWMEGGCEIPSSELTLQRADGSPIQVFSSHVMFRNNSDGPEMYCIDIDLSELKRAESQARQGELVLDSVFQALPDLFFLMDPDSTIQEYRAQKSADLYVPSQNFIGKRIQDLLPPSVASQFEYHMARINAGDELATFEYELEMPHGLRQYEARLCPLPDGPQHICVVRDVTEQKKTEESVRDSEERYRTIFEGAPEGVWLIGADRKTIEINRRLSEILGYQSEEMIGKTPLEFVDDENRKIFINQTTKIETTKRREYEIALRHKDGHNIPTFFSATTIRSATGSVLEAVAFVTDLTEQKIAQKALRRAQKMDAIGQLTGGIAHDFNNILAVILGNLSLFERLIKNDEKALKRVNAMKKAGQRAADLTKQLLSFSRRQATQQANTNINRIITGMESLIVRSLTPEVEVVYQFAEKLWLTEIDPGDFEDALLNLSINARDAMTGRGHLTIETRNATLDSSYCLHNPGSSPGEYVEVAVSDSGEGIPQEQQERIFEPFYTTKETGKGTGLGLSMVFGFVQRSGGFINLYSELGIGTTFRIYLPRTEGEERSDNKALEQSETLPRGTETLLVVDDEAELLELARESLEELGYKVQTASDGRQALEQLAKEPAFDLLFSDVVMPGGINGYELAEQAIGSSPRLKVLLTSGYTGKAMSNNVHAQLNAKLLSKPYTHAELAKRVRTLLDGIEGE